MHFNKHFCGMTYYGTYGINPRKHTSRTGHWMSLNIIHCLLLPFRMTIHESKFCPNNLSKRLNHKSDSLSVTSNYIESHLNIFKSKLTRSHTLTLLPIVNTYQVVHVDANSISLHFLAVARIPRF